MKNSFADTLDKVTLSILYVLAGLTPLFFLNLTTEFFDIPKLALLFLGVIVITALWLFSWIIRGKIVFRRTPLDIPFAILAVVILFSSYFSTSRYIAVLGNFPNVHSSAAAWVVYILLYFIAANHLTDLAKIKTFLYVLYGSAVLASVVSLLAYFGIFLPFDFAKGVNFTLSGSTFNTVSFLLMLLPFPLLSLLNPNKYFSTPASIALAVLFSAVIALTGSIPVYVILAFVYAICLFLPKPAQTKQTLLLFIIPVLSTVLLFLLAYLPFPGNVFQAVEVVFPKEIQLPIDLSWKISALVVRDAPFLGTGPGSYLFNFTSYKPAEFNLQKFWSFTFDTAANEYLQVLGTLGILGLVALLYITFIVVKNSLQNLLLKPTELDTPEDAQDKRDMLLQAMAVSGLVAVGLWFVHASTLVSVVVSFLLLAAMMMSRRSVRDHVSEVAVGLQASTADNKKINLFPILLFVLFLAGAVPVLYTAYKVLAADYYHRLALSQANRNGTLTYQYLQKAEGLNPYNDLYRVDLAQTNFALANALASKGTSQNTTPTTPTLSDKDKQTIQTLLSQAINEGRVSVALSPRSSRNWEVLASIYRNITGVAQNALTFSLDAYGRAIQRDPLNPILRVNVGGIYYSAKNYDMAIRFFNDATSLKSDYANAYYNLALALRDKGDLANAKAAAQQTVGLLKENDPNYKIATDLLSDLTVKLAAITPSTPAPTPAPGQTSALQNPNLPKVNVQGLNNPPQVATPEAVVKTPAPTSAPAPKPTQ